MAGDLRYERRGELVVDFEHGKVWISGDDGPEDSVGLTVDELRWLVLTAGPAMLCELAELELEPDEEEDAGEDGGSPPAEPDATEATDGQLELDPEPVRGAQPGYFAVACPTCRASVGRACTSPGGLVSNRPHAARRKLVEH